MHYLNSLDNKLNVTYFSELSIAEFVENPRDVKSLSWYPVKLSMNNIYIYILIKTIIY